MINKKKAIFIVLAILLIVLFILIYVNRTPKKTVSTTTSTVPLTQAKYLDKIIPGETTEQEVLQDFGRPVASEGGALQYKSTSTNRNNEILIQKGTVSFIKEIVSYKDTKKLSDLVNQYGESGYLYGPDAVNGYFLYYHPELGVAYLANPITETVLEIWYFSPTTIENFKNLYAPDYSDKYPSNGF